MQKEALKLVRWFLRQDGNTAAKLASILGYKSSNTINHWLKTRKIPEHRFSEIKRACGGGGSHAEEKAG